MSYKWDTKRYNQADFTDFNELQKSQHRKYQDKVLQI